MEPFHQEEKGLFTFYREQAELDKLEKKRKMGEINHRLKDKEKRGKRRQRRQRVSVVPQIKPPSTVPDRKTEESVTCLVQKNISNLNESVTHQNLNKHLEGNYAVHKKKESLNSKIPLFKQELVRVFLKRKLLVHPKEFETEIGQFKNILSFKKSANLLPASNEQCEKRKVVQNKKLSSSHEHHYTSNDIFQLRGKQTLQRQDIPGIDFANRIAPPAEERYLHKKLDCKSICTPFRKLPNISTKDLSQGIDVHFPKQKLSNQRQSAIFQDCSVFRLKQGETTKQKISRHSRCDNENLSIKTGRPSLGADNSKIKYYFFMGNAEGKAAEELSQEKKKLLILDMLRKFKIS